jgi:hypothetical protein
VTATQLTPDELRQARAKAFWAWAKDHPNIALASFHRKPSATFAGGKYPAFWFKPARKPTSEPERDIPSRRVGSLYEKGFRRYIRARVDRRGVRSGLGAPGIRSAWW